MRRRTARLLGLSATVGTSMLVAWVAVLLLVIQPSVVEQEPLRVQQVLDAAALLRDGVSKREVEVSRDIDVRLLKGSPDGPPPGGGWLPLEMDGTALWKREGGNHDIAAWTGHTWVVLQAHPPHSLALALALFTAGVPLVLVGFGVGQRADRPRVEAEAQLAQIAAGDLSVRLDPDAGTREVRAVAVAVNQMAGKLQALLAADRQRIAGLSHELRTPLTRIRLELELARREGASVPRLDRVEHDIERFDDMLREMLELSRLEMVGETTLHREPVDLAGLAQWVLEEDAQEDVVVRGAGLATVDAGLVARLLRNLLRNSAAHAPGHRRWIDVRPDTLVVGDDGPGIPLERQAAVLQAFQRGPDSDGHGLGLALVARIAALHGGTVSLSPPPGLVVTVRFEPGTDSEE